MVDRDRDKDPVVALREIGDGAITVEELRDSYVMLYQDVQVDPREWWDPHWIQDRLAAKLAQYGNGAGPGKTAAAAAAARP